MAVEQSWIVGASPECDLVIDEPTVSGHHCRLRGSGKEFSIEDLGSTNGTFVNGVRLEGVRSVRRSDHITLGRAVSMPWPASDAQTVPSAGRWWSSRRVTASAFGGLALGVCIVAWALGGRSPGEIRNDPPSAAHGPSRAASTPALEDEPDGLSAGAKQESQRAEAIYAVIVSDAQGIDAYRVGSAGAISKRHLMTSAAVVQAIEKLRSEFPRVIAHCPAADRQVPVLTWQMHPEFRDAYRDAEAAGADADRIRERLQRADDPNSEVPLSDDELEAELQRIVDLEERRYQATERQTFFDIGILEVEGDLRPILVASDTVEPLAAREPVQALGVAFTDDETYVAPEAPVEARLVIGSIRTLLRPEGGSRNVFRYSIACQKDHHGRTWFGSPVLDSEGRVAAVYSRAAPALQSQEPSPGDSYDATWIGLLSDFAPELLKQK